MLSAQHSASFPVRESAAGGASCGGAARRGARAALRARAAAAMWAPHSGLGTTVPSQWRDTGPMVT